MGKVIFGILIDKALKIREEYRLRYFIETGTFKGGTAIWASQHFSHVWTIENFENYYRMVAEKMKPYRNVTRVLGDSRKMLFPILEHINEPALIWLDAHTMTAPGRIDDCPLLEEIEQIKRSGKKHCIMIDDAHFYQGERPASTDPGLWPDIPAIKKALSGYKVDIDRDVIIALPKHET